MEDILGPDGWSGAVRWVNSGSEAVEMAIQIAKLYINRPNIVTREWEYHGWTMAADALTHVGMHGLSSDTETRDVPGKPGGFHLVPGHNCYRCSLGHTYPGCKTRTGLLPCVDIIGSMVQGLGADSVAGIITETAYGVSALQLIEENFPQFRKMTKDLGILWIDDETLAGMGRLGKCFAYQKYGGGATPDIMILGKGLVNSQLPAAAVVVSKEIAEFFGERRWSMGATYFANPLAMAAVAANLEVMIDEEMVEKSASIGRRLGPKLRKLADKHPCVGQVSGSGCFWALELVKDRETREPFVATDRNTNSGGGEAAAAPAAIVAQKVAEKGINLAGVTPNTVSLLPGYFLSEHEMDLVCDALDYGLAAVDAMCDG